MILFVYGQREAPECVRLCVCLLIAQKSHERLSATQLSALLQSASRSRWYPEFAASLPIAALDGTMKNRLVGVAAAGNARLKTGTLRDVAALAGFVRDVHGRDWVVSAFVNDPQAARGRAVLDRLVAWVADGGAAIAPGAQPGQ